jgi:hypothetical protein
MIAISKIRVYSLSRDVYLCKVLVVKAMSRDWSIKNLYLYLVCLVTLFLFIGGTISAINTAVQLAMPDRPNIPIVNIYYPEFREGIDEPLFNPPPLAELEERRTEQENMEQHYRGYTWRSLLNSIALMIISAPFYLYHWR